MIVLGIDSSPNNCGYCAWDTAEGAKPVVGIYHPGNYGGNNLLLGRDIRSWALRLIDEHSPVSVFIESVTPSGNRINPITWKNQITVTTGIDMACELNALQCYEVGPGQWRKRFLGSASGTGEELKLKAISRAMELGVMTDIDHIAEAMGICWYGMESVDPAFLQRSKHELTRRNLAISRERMQGTGKLLSKSKLFKVKA